MTLSAIKVCLEDRFAEKMSETNVRFTIYDVDIDEQQVYLSGSGYSITDNRSTDHFSPRRRTIFG